MANANFSVFSTSFSPWASFNLLAVGIMFATGLFVTFCFGSLDPVCSLLFFLNDHYTTSISSSSRQIKCILLLLKDDYAFQSLVNLLGIYKKHLQQEIKEAN